MSHPTATAATAAVAPSSSRTAGSVVVSTVAPSFVVDAGSSLSTSISTNLVVPAGVAQLALTAAQAKVNSQIVQRRRANQSRAKQAAIIPKLVQTVLTKTSSRATVGTGGARGTPVTTGPADEKEAHPDDSHDIIPEPSFGVAPPVGSLTDRITEQLPVGHSPRKHRLRAHSSQASQKVLADVPAAADEPPSFEAGIDHTVDADATRQTVAAEKCAPGPVEELDTATQLAIAIGLDPALLCPSPRPSQHVDGGAASAGESAEVAAARPATLVAAGLTGTIVQSLRTRIRAKGLAVKAHASGVHGSNRSKFSRGKNSAAAAGFLQPSQDDEHLSLASLLHDYSSNRSRGSRAPYQLNEEERKITAYYSTIQSAAGKIEQSIDSLLPEDDTSVLQERWSKQGLGPEEIAIRLASRKVHHPSEHDAYRRSFAQVSRLLDGLSAASLRSRSPAADDTDSPRTHSRVKSFALDTPQDVEADQRAAEAQVREEERKEQLKREDEAMDVAEGIVPQIEDGKSDSDDTDDDEEEKLLLVKEKLTAAADTKTPSPEKKVGVSTNSPAKPPASIASSGPLDPAGLFRDLHAFFVGKRRMELVDSKRLQLLESQQAAIEQGTEATRQSLQERLQVQHQHTSDVLTQYHAGLKDVTAKLGSKLLSQLDASLDRGKSTRQHAGGDAESSSEASDARRMKLELIAAMLQARVSEQEELLACIAPIVAPESSSMPHGPIRYAYHPVAGKSFESKAGRLLQMVHALEGNLRSKQEERFALTSQVEKLHERIALTLQFKDKAAMDQREQEELARSEADLRQKHQAIIDEIRRSTEAAQLIVSERTKRNHQMTLAMRTIENELAAIRDMREHEVTRMNALKQKHQRECVQIMRGNIPTHLVSLMERSLHGGGANRGALNQRFDAGAGGEEDGSSFGLHDPDADRSMFSMKDQAVIDLNGFDDDIADDPFSPQSLAAEAAAEAEQKALEAAEQARLQAEAEEKAADLRATTPLSKLKRGLDKVWKQVASQEMAYIPWQEELYNTLQPTYNGLVEETAAIAARLASKQAARKRWMEQLETAKADAEVARSHTNSLHGKKSAPVDGGGAHEDDASDSAESGLESSHVPMPLTYWPTRDAVKPKDYARPVKTKSYLGSNAPAGKAPAGPQEAPELTAARLKTLGTNAFINERIAKFNRSTGQSNSTYKSHIDLLRQDHAHLRARLKALQQEWSSLRATEARLAEIEATVLVPTRKRVELMRAHVERVERAIQAKSDWEAAKRAEAERKAAEEEAQRVADIEETERLLSAALQKSQEGEMAAQEIVTPTAAPSVVPASDAVVPSSVSTPPRDSKSSRRPSVMAAASGGPKSRRPSVHHQRVSSGSSRSGGGTPPEGTPARLSRPTSQANIVASRSGAAGSAGAVPAQSSSRAPSKSSSRKMSVSSSPSSSATRLVLSLLSAAKPLAIDVRGADDHEAIDDIRPIVDEATRLRATNLRLEEETRALADELAHLIEMLHSQRPASRPSQRESPVVFTAIDWASSEPAAGGDETPLAHSLDSRQSSLAAVAGETSALLLEPGAATGEIADAPAASVLAAST